MIKHAKLQVQRITCSNFDDDWSLQAAAFPRKRVVSLLILRDKKPNKARFTFTCRIRTDVVFQLK